MTQISRKGRIVMYKIMSASLGLALLAACNATATTDAGAFNALAAEYNDLAADYSATGRVGAADVALFGSATYDGAMRIQVDTVQPTDVLGEASINVNFGADTIAASFGNFFGQANGRPVEAWTETVPVRAGGVIDVSQPGQQFVQTTLSGTLRSASGNVLTLGPLPLDGSFRDTAPSRFSPPDAMVLQTGPGSIRLDGLNYGTELGNGCETCVIVLAAD